MKINLELTEVDLRMLVLRHFQTQLPALDLTSDNVTIEVKSTNNYKAEWERAAFRARVEMTEAI